MAHLLHDLAVVGEVVGGVILGAGLLLAAPEIAAGAALYEGAEMLAGIGLEGLAEGAFMAGDAAYAVDAAAVVAEGVYGTEAVAEFGLGMMGAGGAGVVGGAILGAIDAGLGGTPGNQAPSTPENNPQALPPPGAAAAAGGGYAPGGYAPGGYAPGGYAPAFGGAS